MTEAELKISVAYKKKRCNGKIKLENVFIPIFIIPKDCEKNEPEVSYCRNALWKSGEKWVEQKSDSEAYSRPISTSQMKHFAKTTVANR